MSEVVADRSDLESHEITDAMAVDVDSVEEVTAWLSEVLAAAENLDTSKRNVTYGIEALVLAGQQFDSLPRMLHSRITFHLRHNLRDLVSDEWSERNSHIWQQ